MRRILFFSLIVIVYSSCNKSNSNNPTPSGGGQDTLNNWVKGSSAGAELDDVWFLTEKTGFVAANAIYTSTDSGKNFTGANGTSNFKVFNLQFLDNLYGFAQGVNQLAVTRDGGASWTLKSLPTNNAFTSQFLFPSTGYYNDYSLGLYKTTDSGSTWRQIYSGAGQGPNFIFSFVDTLHGFLMVNGNFSKTVDGGISWQSVTTGVTGPSFTTYYKMQFLDTLTGYCASPAGLFKTSDGGKTWSNLLPVATTYMVPFFLDKTNGYCLAANAIYKTTNGGNSWDISCKLGTDDFSGMYFLNMNTGWATTFGGYVLRLHP
jgi:photosystem II stability/assembly factor-like uncharacterized protein